jgi:hypothetical protein
MNAKKTLQNRIRGWFPQEPTVARRSAINYQPIQREPWVSRNRLALGLIGGVLTILVALGTILVGLIFSDALRSFNIYQTGTLNPQQIAVQDFVLGVVGLGAGIIGIVGSRIGKYRGGILLIIAGAMAFLFFFVGVVPAVLMIVGGATELGKKPLEARKAPGKFVVFITRLKRFENVAVFSMFLAGLSLITFLGGQLLNEFQDSFGFFLPFFLIYPVIIFIRKNGALKSVFSKILFLSALILIVLSGIFFSFHIITSIGFLAISLVTVPALTLLYAWVGKFSKQADSHSYQATNKHKIISVIFVLAGIILLVFSFALVSHMEQRLGEVSHYQKLLSQDFNLTQQIPDTTLSANLTTQDRLAFGIFPADYFNPHSKGYSSVDFSVSYQPALGEPLVVVYEYDNISGYNRDPIGGWSVTQNGTYILNLHYNYNATAHVNENIGRYWSTTELVPTTVYTPLLATYMTTVLIAASALLIVSVAIPIQQLLREKSVKNKQSSEFNPTLS